MSFKFYRKCLLSMVIIAIIAGIFYYLNYVQKQGSYAEATFVKIEKNIGEEGERDIFEREVG